MADVFCWSRDEERYLGECASRDEALAEARKCYPDHTLFWTGIQVAPDPKKWCPDAVSIIDGMIEQAWDEAGEISETFCDCVNKEQRDELSAAIETTIMGWLDKNNLQPTFWTVDEVKAHVVDVVES